jgi:hypothetical protein
MQINAGNVEKQLGYDLRMPCGWLEIAHAFIQIAHPGRPRIWDPPLRSQCVSFAADTHTSTHHPAKARCFNRKPVVRVLDIGFGSGQEPNEAYPLLTRPSDRSD